MLNYAYGVIYLFQDILNNNTCISNIFFKLPSYKLLTDINGKKISRSKVKINSTKVQLIANILSWNIFELLSSPKT